MDQNLIASQMVLGSVENLTKAVAKCGKKCFNGQYRTNECTPSENECMSNCFQKYMKIYQDVLKNSNNEIKTSSGQPTKMNY